MPYLHIPPMHLGPLTIHAFGLITAAAILLGAKATRHRAAELGLNVHLINRLIPWLVFGVIIGAHLVSMVFYYPGRIIKEPLVLLKFWDGISSFGGILGGLIAAYLFFRRLGIDMKNYTQALLFGAVVSLTIGRFGCSVAHDHPGKVTTSATAVNGWPTEDTPERKLGFYTDGPQRHDLGLYEFLFMVPLTGLLYAVRHYRPFENFHIVLVLILYAPVRFLLDFLRVYEKLYFGLTPGQYFAIISFLAAIYLIVHNYRYHDTHGPPKMLA